MVFLTGYTKKKCWEQTRPCISPKGNNTTINHFMKVLNIRFYIEENEAVMFRNIFMYLVVVKWPTLSSMTKK